MLRLEEGWSIRKTIDMAGRDIAKKNLNRLIKKTQPSLLDFAPIKTSLKYLFC